MINYFATLLFISLNKRLIDLQINKSDFYPSHSNVRGPLKKLVFSLQKPIAVTFWL